MAQNLLDKISKYTRDSSDFIVKQKISSDSRQTVFKVLEIQTRKHASQHVVELNDAEKKLLKTKNYDASTIFAKYLVLIDIPPHPVIEKFIGFSLPPPAIYTEYLKRTYASLLHDIHRKKDIPDWNATAKSKFVFGIAAGMMHVHAANVTHRFLSSKSIFIDDKFKPRITDFYFSKANADQLATKITPQDGTVFYTCPDVLDNSVPYTPKVDVYSYGMLIYTLTTNAEPTLFLKGKEVTNPLNIEKQLENGNRPPLSTDPDHEFINGLIERCWHKDKNARPEFAEIVKILLDRKEAPFPDANQKEYETYCQQVFKKTTNPELEYLDPAKVQAFNEHLQKAQAGDAEEMLQVGLAYDHGTGTKINRQEAIKWYLEAAKLGNTVGMLNAATRLTNSPNPDDQAYATKLFIDAANGGQPYAYVFVAEYYEKQQNYNEALRFYKSMSDNDEACHKNGVWECQYASALYRLCSKDPNAVAESERLLKKNIERVPTAASILSEIKFESNDPAQIQEGLSYLKQAANKKDPMACYKIAQLYEQGQLIQKSLVNALKWYETAIRYGDVLSRTCAATIYKSGSEDVPVDLELAAKYYEEAADMGEKVAMHNFGMMLYNGIGVPKNWFEAVSYLQEAAKKGIRPSMVTLGDIYSTGDEATGIKIDIELAKQYYQGAANLGSEKAAQRLAELQ